VARATGGGTWEAKKLDDLRARFLDVLRDIRGRYVLSYTPEGVSAHGWHEIEVKLRGRRGDVLARPGYHRPGPSQSTGRNRRDPRDAVGLRSGPPDFPS
jgi:hypothetical protein